MNRLVLAAILTLAAAPALAHTGVDDGSGFAYGFAHPVGGLDHVLAMVTVGLFAALLGGAARWAVPASFVVAMLTGGALGMAGIALPAVELGITLSIVVLGIVVALGRRWPLGLAMALVAGFAVFHGHAHGTEMPDAASALGYSAGFALATALLHAAGLGIGLAARRPLAVRIGGAAVAAAGAGLAILA